jgi:hypothetical protein
MSEFSAAQRKMLCVRSEKVKPLRAGAEEVPGRGWTASAAGRAVLDAIEEEQR